MGALNRNGACAWPSSNMAPMKAMKAMKSGARAMGKAAFLKAIADEHGMKSSECSKVVDSLVEIATKEVKKTGVFIIPGLCRIKTLTKPATKAGKRLMFGKEVKVKAQPAKTVVKAFPVAAL